VIVAGILTPLEDALRAVLDWLGPHGAIGLPWGWSIVALTILVRIVLVPLTVRQIHSMQNLQAHAPQMKEIQRKFKGDRAKQNEELMKFYKENNINPAASCLPMLAQLPVFFALYFVLRHFHGQEGDNLSWLGLVDITDKASTGWGPLLIAIYAASQVASSYFMSATVEKSQRILFMVLPIAFIPFIVQFKAGLVLYWVTTNLWTVGQGLITRQLMPKKGAPPPKRTSRTPPRGGDGDGDGDGAARKQPEPKPTPAAAPKRVKKKKKKARR
jgi:YidC/Oxa1 family membrane protein insertase